MIITGTIINAVCILIGGSIGSFLKSGIPKRIEHIIFQALGLFTLFLGMKMAFESSGLFLLMIFSLILGGVIGEIFQLDQKTEGISVVLKSKLKSNNPKFTEGLITSSMLFAIGSMAIIGPMNEALSGDTTLIYTKSLMDGVTAIILSAAFGRGVLFSAIPVFCLQAFVGISASYVEIYLTDVLIKEISAIGGLLILGIGINILKMAKINVINLLPSIVVLVLLYFCYQFI